ncbi:unnamed protein product [Cochlearia groenlandica]
MEEVVNTSSSSSESRRMKRRINRRNKKLKIKAPPSLLNDVIEEIFLRLPIKALIRLKILSKHWKSMIGSRSFEDRHLKIAERLHLEHPRVIFVSMENINPIIPRPHTDMGFRTFCLETGNFQSYTFLHFPQGFDYQTNISRSCDGLFSIHSTKTKSIYVVNPATHWFRQLPPAMFQILMHQFNPTFQDWMSLELVTHLAFVKADVYKLVWLYNSSKYNANDASYPYKEGVTKCEVFDFRSNTWRYLPCTPSYRIYHDQKPAYANGLVYWFTEPYEGRIKVVAFDVRTERFTMLRNIIPAIAYSDPKHIDMCTLDNHLCMSKREDVTMIQYIWRLKPSQDAWEKILTIDLRSCSSLRTENTERRDMYEWTGNDREPCKPVAICKDKKILLGHRHSRGLVKYDHTSKSLDFFYRIHLAFRKVTYFQSLISHI